MASQIKQNKRAASLRKMTQERNNSPKSDRPRVAVVAAGVISPLGAGFEATVEALRTARDCISPVTRFPVGQCRCTTAGQVVDEWLQAVPNDRRTRRLHRASRMTISALAELLEQAPDFEPE